MISCEYGDSPVVSRSKMIKFMNLSLLPFSPPFPTQKTHSSANSWLDTPK
jgi:hypothetical protein